MSALHLSGGCLRVSPLLVSPTYRRGCFRVHPHPQLRVEASRSSENREHSNAQSTTSSSPTDFDGSSLFCKLCLLAPPFFLTAGQALAEETALSYNPGDGEDFIKNAAGVAYILLVGVFLYRVLTRRAQRAREQRIGGNPLQGLETPPSIFEQLRVKLGSQKPKEREAGPLDAFLGAAQAGLLAVGLYTFTTKMAVVLGDTNMPDGYTARNISVTVRTILLGMSWLATFIFAANSVGLMGLFFQWLLFPDTLKEVDSAEEAAARKAAAEAAGPQLPKVGMASKPGELRRAFATAEQQGRKAAAKAMMSQDQVQPQKEQ